jgi:hypothetical protein
MFKHGLFALLIAMTATASIAQAPLKKGGESSWGSMKSSDQRS